MEAPIRLIVFDLSGTTVCDDDSVAKCLHAAAIAHGIETTLDFFRQSIGTNKIHLFEYLLARQDGHDIGIEELESIRFPEYHMRANTMFEDYSCRMVSYYREGLFPMPGAEDVFRWCRAEGIQVATDTGFHRNVSNAIEEGLRWRERGLVDLALDVEDTGGIGRPAPYMIHQAMYRLGVHDVRQVAKVGDTPADLLSGYNAGCGLNVGVLSGANTRETLSRYPHTHILDSVRDLPELINSIR